MLPSLKDMAAKEVERKKYLNESGLGLSQAFQLGERSSQEYALLVEPAEIKLNQTFVGARRSPNSRKRLQQWHQSWRSH